MNKSIEGIKKYKPLYNRGVIGVDEVGRGPLAGPVTVCAVYILDTSTVKADIFNSTIRDSKKLSKTRRNNIFQTFRKNRYSNTKVIYSISSRNSNFIDKYGIQLATQSCVKSCLKKLNKLGVNIYKIPINLDAGLKTGVLYLKESSFVKGDENYTEIAIASIIAKEVRDMYMTKLSRVYSEYKWDKNVGYGTKDHIKAIKKHGITKFHRSTYLKGFKLFDKTE